MSQQHQVETGAHLSPLVIDLCGFSTHSLFLLQPDLLGAKEIHKNVCRVLMAAYESLQLAFVQGLDRLSREKKYLGLFTIFRVFFLFLNSIFHRSERGL